MSLNGQTVVVDASVAVKLFMNESLSDASHALFGRLNDAPPLRLAAPDLLYVECANVFWKAVTRWRLPESDASIFLAQLGELLLHITPTGHLVGDALGIALRYHITVYDAAYVALARALAAPLVTADERLVQTMAGSEHRVVWLGAV